MTDLSPQAQRELANLDAEVAEVQRRAEAAQALRDEVDAIRQTASSEGKQVSVVVDSLGRLTGIEFADSAAGLTGAQLSKAVLDAVAAAREQVGRQVMSRIEAAFGADSETAAAMRGTYLPPPDEPSPDDPDGGSGPGPILYGRRRPSARPGSRPE